MAQIQQEIGPRNGILESLAVEDLRRLELDLEDIDLPVRMQIQAAFRPIRFVYFLESGIASVIAVSKRERRQAEAGVTGFEGMTGLPVVHGTDRSPSNVTIQIAGRGMRISADKLRQAMVESPTLRDALSRFAHVFAVQLEQTSLANAQGTIPERLARWLLMIHDRTEGDHLSLTHELIGLMMGTRRAGITQALGAFCAQGIIGNTRGKVTINDRDALETAAQGLYGVPEDEYRRLFH